MPTETGRPSKLSVVDLPYDERLRILREVLAPTADRGSFDVHGQRYDHFKATDRDRLLTYGNVGGSVLSVEFPPRDAAEVRVVIRDVAQAVDCSAAVTCRRIDLR